MKYPIRAGIILYYIMLWEKQSEVIETIRKHSRTLIPFRLQRLLRSLTLFALCGEFLVHKDDHVERIFRIQFERTIFLQRGSGHYRSLKQDASARCIAGVEVFWQTTQRAQGPAFECAAPITRYSF
jgi:hypothetical protein